MPRVSVLFVFQVISVLGSALTVLKLYQTGLHKHYRYFFLYFAVRVPTLSLTLLLDRRSRVYYYYWIWGQPLYWLLYALVIRELCELILEKYTGLRSLGRWLMYIGTAVAALVSILSLLPKADSTLSKYPKAIVYAFAMNRAFTLFLAVFLIVLVSLLSRYPIRLSRNVAVHAALFTAYFLSESVTMLLRSVFGIRVFDAVDVALTALSSACSLCWFWLLSSQGEGVTVQVLHAHHAREERLLSQLNTLNQTLLKTAKN